MKTIIGVFKSKQEAEQAIGALREHSIADSDISYVGGSKDHSDTTVHNVDGSDVAEGAGSGAVTGGVIGAIAGLVVANGILPGLGTLFVAGPIAAALGLTGAVATTAAGALTGAAAGGLIGALTGLGASDEDAHVYEERIKSGGILVAATIDSSDESEVRHVYEKNGADEVRIYNK
ncbi:MAG: low temperature-induced protein [bacterium]|nr:low temperature-induced protein [bacterium]